MPKQGIKRIVKNSAYLASAKLVTSAARIIYAIALAKFLGPELYGMFNLGMSWYLLFLPMSILGLDSILIREIGRDKNKATELVGHTLAIRGVSSLFIALICFSVGYYLEQDNTAKTLVFIFSIALLVRGLSVWVNSLFTAYEKSEYIFKLETGFRLLEVVAGLLILWTGGGVIEIAIFHTVSWSMQSVFGFYLVRKKLLILTPLWELKPIIKLIKLGFPFVISTFLGAWLLQGGLFIIRFFEGYDVSLGMYALALQALLIIGSIVAVIGSASLPALSRSIDRDDGKSEHFIDVVLRGGILMGGTLAISGLALGAELIDLIIGPSYLPVAELLPWTLFLVTGYFLIAMFNSVITSMGNYHKLMLVALIGSLVFSTLAVPFYKNFGVMGIIWSTAIGITSVIISQIFIIQKKHKITFFNSISRPLLAVFLGLSIIKITDFTSAWVNFTVGILVLIIGILILKVLKSTELHHLTGLFTKRKTPV